MRLLDRDAAVEISGLAGGRVVDLDPKRADAARVADTQQRTMIERAREFARAQCDPNQIAAALVTETGVPEAEFLAFVHANGDDIHRHMVAARAKRRLYP